MGTDFSPYGRAQHRGLNRYEIACKPFVSSGQRVILAPMPAPFAGSRKTKRATICRLLKAEARSEGSTGLTGARRAARARHEVGCRRARLAPGLRIARVGLQKFSRHVSLASQTASTAGLTQADSQASAGTSRRWTGWRTTAFPCSSRASHNKLCYSRGPRLLLPSRSTGNTRSTSSARH